MIIGKRFTFDAAHFLPYHAGKCKELHGHTWTVEVEIEDSINEDFGWVIDFKDFSDRVNEVLDELDHKVLNNFVINPTCENLVVSIHKQLSKRLLRIRRITLQEGEGGWACLESTQDEKQRQETK